MDFQALPWSWSFDPQIWLGVAVVALLYTFGLRYSLRSGLTTQISWWRCACFAGGLATIILALESPLDAWSGIYLWSHMLQHLLLVLLAAPLLLLGAPLWPIWRATPLGARRGSLRWLMMHPKPRRLGLAIGRALGSPRVAWVAFVFVFDAWHVPALYDLTLRNQTVHDLEHALFLFTALLFWAQVIPSHPLKPKLNYGARAMYTMSAGFATSLPAIPLTFAVTPIYGYYATLPRTPGMISAVTD
ncbi:MAG: cytochrome c oxidase assembly protein, partial [Ktedonobacterales bacterium]